MPNPNAYTFAIVALAATLSLLIVSLSAEHFAAAWRTLWPRARPSPSSPSGPTLESTLPPEFGGICAARAAEAIGEGVPDGMRVRCPVHGTAPGTPCLSEAELPVDAAWAKVATDAEKELNKLSALTGQATPKAPAGEPGPGAPVLHQVRAFSDDADARRCEVVTHDPTRPDPWELRLLPPADMDAATLAATEGSRRRWATVEEIETFWPVIVPPPAPPSGVVTVPQDGETWEHYLLRAPEPVGLNYVGATWSAAATDWIRPATAEGGTS